MNNIIEVQKQFEFDVFPKRELAIIRGEGAKLWDQNGFEYIDFAAGIGVASIGHGNKGLAEALKNQAEKLITCPGTFYNDQKALLLKKIAEITPASLNRTYLSNSGTEAVEAALKFARFHTGKTDFIALANGFHGRTLGALSATFKKEYRDSFEPLVPGFTHVPSNDLEKLRSEITDKTAGIILELIQGEGGIMIADREYVSEVRKLCTEKNILLILDEIQTGFCRTGKMFAFEHFDIVPDILCLAKAIGGGFPLGAAVCSDNIEVPKGKHGTTFGGNPLACAAGNYSIEFMQKNDLAKHAGEKGKYFLEELKKINSDKISEVRGMGLMIGVELKEKVQPLLQSLMDEKIIALPAGYTVLRLLPPLVISYEEIKKGVGVIKKILEN